MLQDKRTEHVKFQQHAMELIKKVSGPGGNAKLPGDSDFSLEMMHRASVVAQTKITFSKKQLLQLIQVSAKTPNSSFLWVTIRHQLILARCKAELRENTLFN